MWRHRVDLPLSSKPPDWAPPSWARKYVVHIAADLNLNPGAAAGARNRRGYARPKPVRGEKREGQGDGLCPGGSGGVVVARGIGGPGVAVEWWHRQEARGLGQVYR